MNQESDGAGNENNRQLAERSKHTIQGVETDIKTGEKRIGELKERTKNLPDDDPRVASLQGANAALDNLKTSVAAVEMDRMNLQKIRELGQARSDLDTQMQLVEGLFGA